MILPKSFYSVPTINLAKYLLGNHFVYQSDKGRLVGKIVETEAYVVNDPANHAFRGQTARTAVMFGEAGHVYIYQIYGLHYCLNVVSGEHGVGEAVLIRALEPVEGVDLMAQNRRLTNRLQLTNGPANLVSAFGIPPTLNSHDLTQPPLTIEQRQMVDPDQIVTTQRIGLKKAIDEPLRFYIKDSQYISRK